jgi:ATP-dependent DNA helicase RecG
MLILESSVSQLSPIAKKLTGQLKKLKVETVRDLVFHFPFRYDDFSKILTIVALQERMIATVKVKVDLIQTKRSFRRKLITEAIVSDETGSIKAVWFGQPYIGKILKVGDEIYLAGKVEDYYGLQFSSPNYEKVKGLATTHTARLVPVYSTTGNLTSKQIRYLVRLAFPLIKKLPEHLPWQIKRELGLIDLSKACQGIHFPQSQEELQKAQKRLKFDELFIVQLAVKFLKQNLAKLPAQPLPFQEEIIKNFVQGLPFKLTNDQRKAAWQILKDLARNRPTNRLLEGEVGSGKTVVAVMAMLNAVVCGGQAAFMAPTEILARQHYQSISKLLRRQKVKVGLLTRSQIFLAPEKLTKGEMLKKIAAGEVDIIIGTHALIAEKVHFKNLTLAIVDEQHRFGVNQRRLLREKSGVHNLMPHLLSMTATPIPRTLTLVFYGDLDISIIKELPKGRKKILTRVIQPTQRPKAYQFIKEQIRRGRQIFVICPLIDPSDKLGVKSVKEEYQRLKKDIFPDLQISYLHGRLKAQERERIMTDFLANKINILVSTSVVEVGIDVPNATVMMIEDAERFGLAQLHQFRGRVGRSKHQSYCFLFSQAESFQSILRLQALIKSEDGFSLAEKDLEFRGPGEIYGTRQSGMIDYFKIANLFDYQLINLAKEQVEKVLTQSPDIRRFPLLLEKVSTFQKAVHLE